MDHPAIKRRRAALVALASMLAVAACNKPASSAPPAPADANTAAPAAPAPPASSDAADAADAKAFLEGLYAHYVSAKDHSFEMFGANVHEVFDPEMIQLLKDDAKAESGEAGVLDGDYLCNCQDYVSLKTVVTVQSATPTTAKAHADFTDVGMPSDGMRHNDFDLVKVNGAWRIHDITDPTDPSQGSLRTALQNEINAAKGPKKNDPNVAP